MTSLQQRVDSGPASVEDGGVELPKARRRGLAVVVGSVLVMLAVGAWGLDRGSMWLDEAATWTVATRPVHQIRAVLDHIDVVHGFYYLAMHVWLSLGGGEVWMRVPSVLGMGVAAGATAALGVRLAGPRTGLLAGLLLAGWPLVSYYAQEGRSFALVTGAVLLGTWCLVQALTTQKRAWWWAYTGSVVVAALLHEFAVLAVVAHGVTMLLVRPGWRAWRAFVVAGLVCAVCVAPLAWTSQEQSGQVSYMTSPTWDTLVDLTEKFLSTSLWLSLVLLGLATVGTVAAVRGARRQGGVGLAAVALPLLLVPVALLLGASLVHPLFQVRYVLFSVVGLPLLTARGVEALAGAAGRATGRAVVGSVVAAVLVLGVSVAQLPALRHERTTDSRSQDFAGAAAVVKAGARPGDGVVFLPLTYRLGAMAYTDAYAGLDDLALKKSAVQAANLRGTSHTPDQIRKELGTKDRVWVVGTKNLRVRSTDKVGAAEMAVLHEQFTEERLFPAPGVAVRSLEVHLFVRKGAR
ncbi:mannosyltransferase [Microlunatus sagamiharensis]|uniref:Mannosyltransferase n=1 Tax=Microlunatus sagamiharensis TaxID=546874 RepID=A0A1H2NJF7_9ACTN|nr:glycosyltransferase family 39 protein [Microlunatus sagamiharensis]SDV04946.1 mannosyltransferase [Microlunatus sagamiharensis]